MFIGYLRLDSHATALLQSSIQIKFLNPRTSFPSILLANSLQPFVDLFLR